MSRPSPRIVATAFLTWVTTLASGCVIGVLDVDDGDSLTRVEVLDHQVFSLDLETQSLLQVVALNGSVRVQGVAGAEGVTVNATRRVQARTRAQAEDHLYSLRVLVSKSANAILAETSQPSSGSDVTYVVEYDILVPPDLEVDIVQANGEIRVEDVGADVWVENGNGNVTLDHIVGGVWVAVANGEVNTDVFLPRGKTVDQAVGNGSINLKVQREVSAELSAQVGNGTISIFGRTVHALIGSPHALSGLLGGGDGFIGLSVGNGWIQVQGT
jgi:hypothetical protein